MPARAWYGESVGRPAGSTSAATGAYVTGHTLTGAPEATDAAESGSVTYVSHPVTSLVTRNAAAGPAVIHAGTALDGARDAGVGGALKVTATLTLQARSRWPPARACVRECAGAGVRVYVRACVRVCVGTRARVSVGTRE